jgi:ATP adenylyltransferase/5',5'''-P-1,P-4-tetraphosphate phosphorylase II
MHFLSLQILCKTDLHLVEIQESKLLIFFGPYPYSGPAKRAHENIFILSDHFVNTHENIFILSDHFVNTRNTK